MHIKRATKKDALAIIDNNILLAKESEQETLKREIVEKGVKSLFSHPEKGFYLVAKENNIVIGQLMITFEWSDWRNTEIWWIQSVYVHQDHRNKGVFSALFDSIKKRAKRNKIPLLRLYVHKNNTSAQQVYEKKEMTKHAYILYETSV